jgi:hypothetical protein
VLTVTFDTVIEEGWSRLEPAFLGAQEPPNSLNVASVDIEESAPCIEACDVPKLLMTNEVPCSWRLRGIVTALVDGGLVRNDDGSLTPTDLGCAVDSVVARAYPDLATDIANIERTVNHILTESVISAPTVIGYVNGMMSAEKVSLLDTPPCPQCGKTLKVRAEGEGVVLLCRKCKKKKQATVVEGRVAPKR